MNFNQARHGIYRDIPVINNVSREDGSTSRIQARVTNIKTYGEKKTVGRRGFLLPYSAGRIRIRRLLASICITFLTLQYGERCT